MTYRTQITTPNAMPANAPITAPSAPVAQAAAAPAAPPHPATHNSPRAQVCQRPIARVYACIQMPLRSTSGMPTNSGISGHSCDTHLSPFLPIDQLTCRGDESMVFLRQSLFLRGPGQRLLRLGLPIIRPPRPGVNEGHRVLRRWSSRGCNAGEFPL
jgi:hypothetical protein